MDDANKRVRHRAEKKLYDATVSGDVAEVKEILRKNPTLNVNWKNEAEYDWTALHIACSDGHDSIVLILLAHPDINVNVKNIDGITPFLSACAIGRTACAIPLLRDSRVLVNEPDNAGSTPLKDIISSGHLAILKWWIAAGLLDDFDVIADSISATRNPEKEAWESRENFQERSSLLPSLGGLLQGLRKNPTKIWTEVREELGITGQSSTSFVANSLTYSSSLFRILCDHPTKAHQSTVRRISLLPSWP